MLDFNGRIPQSTKDFSRVLAEERSLIFFRSSRQTSRVLLGIIGARALRRHSTPRTGIEHDLVMISVHYRVNQLDWLTVGQKGNRFRRLSRWE